MPYAPAASTDSHNWACKYSIFFHPDKIRSIYFTKSRLFVFLLPLIDGKKLLIYTF